MMKLKKNRFNENQPKIYLPKEGKVGNPTIFTYVGTAFTTLGVLAWTAGHSYSTGYWERAGIPNSYFTNTIQETMFGSIHAARTWVYFFLLLIISGIALVFGSIRRKTPKRLNPKSRQSKWKLDASMSLFGISLAGIAYVLMLAMLGFAIWFSSAAEEGEEAYLKVVCSIRSSNQMPNDVLMADGTKLHGRVIARSDNITLLLNPQGLHVVNIKEKPTLMEIVPLPAANCKYPTA